MKKKTKKRTQWVRHHTASYRDRNIPIDVIFHIDGNWIGSGAGNHRMGKRRSCFAVLRIEFQYDKLIIYSNRCKNEEQALKSAYRKLNKVVSSINPEKILNDMTIKDIIT